MLKYIVVLFISGCSIMPQHQVDLDDKPADVAKVVVKPTLVLPDPLDLEPYKVDTSTYRVKKEGDNVYIVVPEKDIQKNQDLLLALKNRILELQKIITDAAKLN